jgi:hypothetical protein
MDENVTCPPGMFPNPNSGNGNIPRGQVTEAAEICASRGSCSHNGSVEGHFRH